MLGEGKSIYKKKKDIKNHILKSCRTRLYSYGRNWSGSSEPGQRTSLLIQNRILISTILSRSSLESFSFPKLTNSKNNRPLNFHRSPDI